LKGHTRAIPLVIPVRREVASHEARVDPGQRQLPAANGPEPREIRTVAEREGALGHWRPAITHFPEIRQLPGRCDRELWLSDEHTLIDGVADTPTLAILQLPDALFLIEIGPALEPR